MIESTRAGRATFWPMFLAVSGALPLLTAHFWYKIGLLASAQVGTVRTLGLLGVFGLGFLFLALVAAVLATVLKWGQASDRWRRAARVGFFALAAGNLASVGLSLFYWAPSLAPMPWKAGAGAALAAVVIAFWRYRPAEQVLVTRVLIGCGLLLLLVPAVASPWVVMGALAQGAHLKDAPRLPAEARPRADKPRRIVLVTFDSLPAWATSMANPARDATPAMARFAKEAVWYPNARSAGAWTLVSMPTVLTGLSPSTHQLVVDNPQGMMPITVGTGMAGYLKRAGYRSLYSTMIIEPGFFGLRHEFERGYYSMWALFARDFQSSDYLPLRESWQYFSRSFLKMKPAASETPVVGVPPGDYPLAVVRSFEQGLAMLEASSEPTFLWVHVGAPHAPYFAVPRRQGDEPPATARSRQVTGPEVVAANEARDPVRARDIQGVFETYVEFADGEFERFLAALKRSPDWKDTMLVVTADHGENFAPGEIGHDGPTLGSELDHVPLIIHAPGAPMPRREAAPVGHQDLLPTILGRVYDRLPPGLPGQDLLAGPVSDKRILFTAGRMAGRERAPNIPLAMAAYQGHFTYVSHFDTGKEALYDRRVDPFERHDVAERHPEVARRLEEALRREYARFR